MGRGQLARVGVPETRRCPPAGGCVERPQGRASGAPAPAAPTCICTSRWPPFMSQGDILGHEATVKVNAVFGGATGGSADPRRASGRGADFGPDLLREMVPGSRSCTSPRAGPDVPADERPARRAPDALAHAFPAAAPQCCAPGQWRRLQGSTGAHPLTVWPPAAVAALVRRLGEEELGSEEARGSCCPATRA